MQEWESSAGYLAVVLFALTKVSDPQTCLWMITDSLEEEDLIKAWARSKGWTIVEPFRQPRWLRRGIQEAKNLHSILLFGLYRFSKKDILRRIEEFSFDAGEELRSFWRRCSIPHHLKQGQYKDPFFGNLYEFLLNKGKHGVYLSDSIPFPDASTHTRVKECQSVIFKMPLILLNWGEWAGVLVRLFADG